MKLQKIRSGFTLIELLVVITIIGILATWAVNVYTSQIQKARDTTRISDMKALQSWIEQFYQDGWVYPDKTAASFSWVTAYVPKLPQDPKSSQASSNSVFDYLYNASTDANLIPFQEYEVSTHFEQIWNITKKAAADGWDDDFRQEIGINITDTAWNTTEVNAWSTVSIASTAVKYSCVAAARTVTAPGWSACANMMLIRN